jgi:hypothetical protein
VNNPINRCWKQFSIPTPIDEFPNWIVTIHYSISPNKPTNLWRQSNGLIQTLDEILAEVYWASVTNVILSQDLVWSRRQPLGDIKLVQGLGEAIELMKALQKQIESVEAPIEDEQLSV